MFLKFLVVRVCGKNFLNEGMKHGCLGYAFLAHFSEPSLRREYLVENQEFTDCLVKAVGVRLIALAKSQSMDA